MRVKLDRKNNRENKIVKRKGWFEEIMKLGWSLLLHPLIKDHTPKGIE